MKSFLTSFLFWFAISASAQMSGYEVYDTSDATISSAVNRSNYYYKYSFFGGSLNKEEFLATADRSKGVVIYAHGCGRNSTWDRDIRKFYLESGYYVVDTDFISRKDSGPSCTLSGNTFIYKANVYERLKTREMEISAHVKFLKSQGFNKIIAAGFSEGGMVIQMLSSEVSAAVIHSMSCVPTWFPPNPKNKTLRIVSKRDPIILPRQGIISLCEDHDWYKNFTNVLTDVDSHAPVPNDFVKISIKDFLSSL